MHRLTCQSKARDGLVPKQLMKVGSVSEDVTAKMASSRGQYMYEGVGWSYALYNQSSLESLHCRSPRGASTARTVVKACRTSLLGLLVTCRQWHAPEAASTPARSNRASLSIDMLALLEDPPWTAVN